MPTSAEYTRQVRDGVNGQVGKLIPQTDRTRVMGLNTATTVLTAHSMALSVARGRAMAKYGAESDQAAVVDARIAALTTLSTTVGIALDRADIPAPVLGNPAAQTGIYGRIASADGSGIAGAAIEALSADAAAKIIGDTKSDDKGAFFLRLPVTQTPAAETHRASTKAPPVPGVQLRAIASGFLRLDSADTFPLTAGALYYRELVMTPAPTRPVRR